MTTPALRAGLLVGLGVTALSLLAYWPLLQLPLISDDYLQIGLAREYGSWEGQKALFADALYRCRATSLWLTWLFDRAFGPHAIAGNLLGLALHIANSMLIFALGYWSKIGWKVSTVAALFFAVYEGHQEAVVWFAALPELLVFFFGLVTLLAWARWLESGKPTWLAAVFAAYIMCLLSKESGVVVPALMAAYAWAQRELAKRWMPLIALLSALTLAYAWSIFDAQRHHLHFNDGTFDLSAPFYSTLAISIGRMLWFWGLLALIAGFASRSPEFRALLPAVAVWMVVTFLPYVFLAYMPRVPSRHTYFASAGLALLIGSVWIEALPRLRMPRWGLALLAAAIIGHNSLYLWIKKLPQYRERSEATEQLLAFARAHPGPVYIRCFPYGEEIVYHALEISGGKTRDQIRVQSSVPGGGEPVFCFDQHP